jgi:general secretion pathway protein F
VTDVQSAATRQEVLRSLAERHLFPVQIEETDASALASSEAGNVRVAPKHVAIFLTQMADLLRSGVPLLRSLELLERQSISPKLQVVVRAVRDDVAEGKRFAEALGKHPRTFGELAVSMVRAGEEGGFLEDVLQRIANFLEHQQELRARVTGAMVYPLFLLGMGTLIVAGMLVFFVPKFEPMFERMQAQGSLPWATTTLLAFSNSIRDYGGVILIALAVGGFAIYNMLQSDEGRLAFDRARLWGLKVGRTELGFGPLVRSLAIARFCRILGTLLANGVPILQALDIAKDATGNRVLANAIAEAAENVTAGKSLAVPLRQSGQFPEQVVEMIAVGEEANNLEQVLVDISDNMERQSNRTLDLVVRMLEPIMLTFMAGIILFVVVALMLPILRSSGLF